MLRRSCVVEYVWLKKVSEIKHLVEKAAPKVVRYEIEQPNRVQGAPS